MLLDSHVALRWLDDSVFIGPQCSELIAQADEGCMSAVTPWELGIEGALGKLTMPDGMAAALELRGFLPLAISVAHAEFTPALPAHHGDPFDRMLELPETQHSD
jgi:PIN domain nuclease of toxin-antitoxin system